MRCPPDLSLMNCRCPAESSTRGSEALCSAGSSNAAGPNAQNRGSGCDAPVPIEATQRASADRREAVHGCMQVLALALALVLLLLLLLAVPIWIGEGKQRWMPWFAPDSNRLDRGRKYP